MLRKRQKHDRLILESRLRRLAVDCVDCAAFVFSFLSVRDHFRLAATCRALRKCCHPPGAWSNALVISLSRLRHLVSARPKKLIYRHTFGDPEHDEYKAWHPEAQDFHAF